MRTTLAAAVLLILPMTTACRSVEPTRGGQARMISGPFEVVWKVVPDAATEIGLRVVSSSEAEGLILTEQGATAKTWTERLSVYVEREDKDSTKVEVVSKLAVGSREEPSELQMSLLDTIAKKVRLAR